MYQCPHCQLPGIPVWRKASLGHGHSIRCRCCGGRVGVPNGRSLLAALPFLAILTAIVVAFELPGALVGAGIRWLFVGALAAWLLAVVLNFWWVPLIRR